jgi:hypothetical protein
LWNLNGSAVWCGDAEGMCQIGTGSRTAVFILDFQEYAELIVIQGGVTDFIAVSTV